jgi:hypothetical protein
MGFATPNLGGSLKDPKNNQITELGKLFHLIFLKPLLLLLLFIFKKYQIPAPTLGL